MKYWVEMIGIFLVLATQNMVGQLRIVLPNGEKVDEFSIIYNDPFEMVSGKGDSKINIRSNRTFSLIVNSKNSNVYANFGLLGEEVILDQSHFIGKESLVIMDVSEVFDKNVINNSPYFILGYWTKYSEEEKFQEHSYKPLLMPSDGGSKVISLEYVGREIRDMKFLAIHKNGEKRTFILPEIHRDMKDILLE